VPCQNFGGKEGVYSCEEQLVKNPGQNMEVLSNTFAALKDHIINP